MRTPRVGGAALGLAAAATVMLASAPAASALGEDDASLRQRVAELEARLAELKQTSTHHWLTEQRAADIRALVQDVLADADTRASLLQGGGTAGWDNGFFLASADGNFRLNLKGLVQVRYVFNHQDDDAEDSSRGGFESRRTKLIFTGHVVDPSWIYKVQGNFSSMGGGFVLEDAFIGKALGNGWTFLAGQVKVPMQREFLVENYDQLPVERSLVDAEFNAGRTQGAAIDYRGDWLHFTFGYTDGHTATGGTNAPALAYDTEYSLTARAEVLLAGSWDQFADLTSWKGEEFGFMLGGGIHYQDGEYGTAADEIEALQWTVDASLEFGGANLLAYVVGRHLDSTTIDLDQYGFVIQGGFFVTDDVELFARYEWGDDDISSEDLSIVTVGFNKYFSRQQLRWSCDVGYGLNEVSATWGDGLLGTGGAGAGWRTDASDNDGQIVFRTQLQLKF
ncbi:MAG: hypothetical protein HRU76_10935 [Phycisphaeraceae bacterium]|nr:hypothetical protein [Phycisphaerales bacterium]QOJ18070.1 MAG: hypothetical protein HRU76_10935 [Phycisphaeraceae bacterium]